jgi:hypothetical protein
MRTPSAQPDLFGEADAAEARSEARREWNANPQTCPLCHRTEATGFRLNQHHMLNYGPDDWRIYTSTCMVMHLTRNHVLYDVQTGQLDRLPTTVATAREAWQHRLDDLRASLAGHGIDLDALP